MVNRRRQDSNPLGKPAANADLFKMDREIFGAIQQADEGMQTAYPVSIFQVTPDPKQPRRILPGALRYTYPVSDVLATWWDMASEEAGREIPVEALLRGEETERSQEHVDRGLRPIEAGFMKLIDLAATIRRDGGLINPITVYRIGEAFRLETGERRWLAHHLLVAALSEAQWEKITAREVNAPSIWRQAHENTSRDDLNAVSLARQLALLVMDIYQGKGVLFDSYENFQHDRHFYAQVADGNQYPLPDGDREKVIAAMGKSNVTQVNQHRALLRLPDDVWQMADQENTAEYALRTTLKSIRDEQKAAEESRQPITVVIPHASTQAQASEAAETPAGEPSFYDEVIDESGKSSLPDMTTRRLDWAYRRAARALTEQETYFSAQNADTTPEKLNELVAQGLLTTRTKVVNTNPVAVTYRISDAGAEALGEEPLQYNFSGSMPSHLPPGAQLPAFNGGQSKPISVGEALSGKHQPSNTPPRRTPKPLLQGADRTMVQTALQATDGRLNEIDGVREAILTIERSIDAQKRVLEDLYRRRDRLEKD